MHFMSEMRSVGFLLFFFAIIYITTDVMQLSSRTAWLVRSLLAALGLGLWGAFVYWRQRKRTAPAAGAAARAPGAAVEVTALMREAETRLAASRLGREAKLGTLPAIFLIGEPGATKTCTLVNSGVEPELLAGQVYEEGNIAPTATANFWFARSTVFVEAAGRLLGDAGNWLQLVKGLRPAGMRSLMGKSGQPPRGVVVCVDSEEMLKPGAQDSLPVLARRLNARLAELSHSFGIHLPVYVLFTKMDRLAFFLDYVADLTDTEATQVVGVTLPIGGESNAGVYAEAATARLTTALNELYFSLCDKRLPFLARAHEPAKLAGVYEFPREFRKLRSNMVRFLVELCRPSQLRTSPFLRGAYFSGARPVVVRETARAARPQEREGLFGAPGASAFNLDAPSPEQSMAGGAIATRKVPQWIFLGHLFHSVILADRAAQGAEGSSTRTDRLRRLMLAGVALISLIAITGFSVSYLRNRAMERRASEAARGIVEARMTAGGLPGLDSLKRLDTLRESVETLSRYEREGPPWSLRWGLYVGSEIYPTVRRLYFDRFHGQMFGETQAGLLDWLRRLPAAPGPNDQYAPTYDTLKAYLITTSYHEKSTRAFLPPFLTVRWLRNRELDPDRRRLAVRQWEFYADELKAANPYSSDNDAEAIERARRYLAQFGALERIYQMILAEANSKHPPVNFNKQFSGSAAYVISNKDVAGAFSKEGWAFFQDAVKHVERYYGGEEWVLGKQAFTEVDRPKLEQQLLARYHADFIGNWREYLNASSVAGYANIADAARKLQQLSSNQSFLLALFCLASTHTVAAPEDVRAPYQPVHHVTPKGCMDRYVNDINSTYMTSLGGLQAAFDQLAKSPTPPGRGDPLVAQTLSEASNALRVTRQIAQSFRIDREGHVEQRVQKLMEDPIKRAEALLGHLGPAQLNAAGKQLCTKFQALTNKYPFRTASPVDATVEEVNAIFRPGDGALWSFHENELKQYLVKQGDQYVATSSGGIRITPQFAAFFNRSVAFADAFYKGGARDPRLTFIMRPLPAEGIQKLTLRLEGQTLASTGQGGNQMQFTWPGTIHEARLAGSLGGPEFGFLTWDGIWAVFRFFGDADKWSAAQGGYAFDWVPRQGQSRQPLTLSSGRPLTIRYFLDMQGAPPIFQKDYLSGFQCVSTVAQ